MKTTKTVKAAKTVKSTKSTQVAQDSINWNAKYYRERAAKFFETASYSASSEPIVVKTTKKEIAAVLKAATKVRHNRPSKPQVQPSKYVMIGGIPHKLKDGKFVALTSSAE